MSDLVNRLRESSSSPARNIMGVGEYWNLADEAADAIERKDAAIAELVAGLIRLRNECDVYDGLAAEVDTATAIIDKYDK